jgi:hypothetical protein
MYSTVAIWAVDPVSRGAEAVTGTGIGIGIGIVKKSVSASKAQYLATCYMYLTRLRTEAWLQEVVLPIYTPN